VRKKENISISDKKTWEDYLKDPKDISDKESKLENSSINRLRFKFDLHGYKLTEANEKVREIIFSCSEKKYKEILLITGKGLHSSSGEDVYVSKNLSKLRYSIPDYINHNNDLSSKVREISTATAEDGGDGAIIIKLKKTIK
tara:strand:+ start:32 stop:457 length:426 start_codon:yes stop_codon:yes gene_type:complete